MYSLLSFHAEPLLGLDIHPEEVRFVKVLKKNGKIQIIQWGRMDLLDHIIHEGKIENREQLKEVLQNVASKLLTKQRAVAIALPFIKAMSKRIKLPRLLNDLEREAEISSHLPYYMPGVTDRLNFDFVSLQQLDEEHDEVLLVAARQEQVMEYVTVVEEAGFTVKVVDIDIFALIRAIRFCYPLYLFQEVIAVLEVNVTQLRLLIFQQNEILFCQEWEMKQKNPTDVYQEVQHKLQLFFSMHKNLKLNRLVLCGIATYLSELTIILKETFEIPIDHMRPFFNEFQSSSSQMLVSCGLAMRGCITW